VARVAHGSDRGTALRVADAYNRGILARPFPTASRPAVPPRARVLASAALLLAVYWLVPVRLDEGPRGPSSEACLHVADRHDAANAVLLPTLEQCAGLMPEDAELHADLGDAYAAAGRSSRAEAAYRSALDRDPDYADVHARLARTLLTRGATAEARAHAEAALRLQPNQRQLLDLLAEISRVPERGTP
jgi:tetratricopeptide (TPR) repeat protein